MSQKFPQNQIQIASRFPSVFSSVGGRAASLTTSVDELIGEASTSAFHVSAYHELLENPHVEIDGLQRLQENLARLEDLHGRLQFMMRDLSGLIRRR